MSSRVVAVFGATGTQGSSVVHELLKEGTFAPRAVTRNPASERAQKLKALGADVVQADLWDINSLKNTLAGCEAVFALTDYYDPKSLAQGSNSEMILGKNLVDAAMEANIKFFIWSSLPSATKISNGKYRNVHHFDNKAAVEDYLQSVELPSAILHTGWFSENLWNYQNLVQSQDSSSFEVVVPRYDAHSPQYITWIERDLGQCALALLKNYDSRKDEILDNTFYAVSEKMTYTQLADVLQNAFGKPVTFTSSETCGMQELDDMYAFQSEFGLYPHSAIPDPRLVNLGVQFHTMKTFAEFAKTRYV